MSVEVHEVGNSKSKVVVVDNFLPEAHRAIDIAASVAPFPPEGITAYPGRRYQISPGTPESAYVMLALKASVPFIRDIFGATGFDIVETSFSMVTMPPQTQKVLQRTPHMDSTDSNQLAILHHLHDLPSTGTAFYRHNRTGIERLTDENMPVFKQGMADDDAEYGPLAENYAGEGDERYEKLLQVNGRFNRTLIYQGCILHTGILPPDFNYSNDPRTGRLTGTLFVKMRRRN